MEPQESVGKVKANEENVWKCSEGSLVKIKESFKAELERKLEHEIQWKELVAALGHEPRFSSSSYKKFTNKEGPGASPKHAIKLLTTMGICWPIDPATTFGDALDRQIKDRKVDYGARIVQSTEMQTAQISRPDFVNLVKALSALVYSPSFLLGSLLTVLAIAFAYFAFGASIWSISKNEDQIGRSLNDLGIAAIWNGDFSNEEDRRLKLKIKDAKSIKFMAYNGDQFFQHFTPELTAFFERGGSSIQVLLANPDEEFYLSNTRLTLKRNLSKIELDSYKQHLIDAVARLNSMERNLGQVEVRLFRNEMRLPMIIVDDQYCFLTVRLPPHEARQSLRVELDETEDGFCERCIEHFNQVWSQSKPYQEKSE